MGASWVVADCQRNNRIMMSPRWPPSCPDIAPRLCQDCQSEPPNPSSHNETAQSLLKVAGTQSQHGLRYHKNAHTWTKDDSTSIFRPCVSRLYRRRHVRLKNLGVLVFSLGGRRDWRSAGLNGRAPLLKRAALVVLGVQKKT